MMPNLQEEAEMLEWAGINFGDETTYLIQQSLKRLAMMSNADKINFCGKIFGQTNDYWVASGSLAKAEEFIDDKNLEARGVGANKLVFWVTTNLLNDWVQLPDVRPEHIVAARKIKHTFTGDLNATFDSNPAFPGKERHLLRAQLGRIFHATAIIPKDFYLPPDEENPNEIKYNEEFQMPSTQDLNNLENWSNLHPTILKIGRTTHLYSEPPEEWDEDRKAAYMAMMEDDKQDEAPFRGINEHVPLKGLEFCWTSKIVGDTQQYNLPPPKEGTTTYAVNVIRSLRWPGAVTVAKGGKFVNFYLGYGLKKGDASFQPTEPPEVQQDPDEAEMNDEPTPKTAPEELPEDDTDEEAKEEEDEQ